MTDARAVLAAFTEYRMVKTRSVLQLLVEIPLEQQADVFAKLGYPLPGAETWVAIALLNPATVVPPSVVGSPGSAEAPPSARAGAPNPEEFPKNSPRIPQAAPTQGVPIVGQAASPAAEPAPGVNPVRSAAAKKLFHSKDAGEQSVTRAAMLVDTPAFWRWIGARDAKHADGMLKTICGIELKKELAWDETALAKFNELRLEFELASGRLAEIRR